MTAAPVQRWGTVPTAEASAGWAPRHTLPRWRAGDETRVRAFIARQTDAPMQAWLTARAARYAEQFSSAIPDELEREAMLDLICWQRRINKPAELLEWLRAYELMAGSAEQGAETQEDRKGQ